jgi:hypothetical protein
MPAREFLLAGIFKFHLLRYGWFDGIKTWYACPLHEPVQSL